MSDFTFEDDGEQFTPVKGETVFTPKSVQEPAISAITGEPVADLPGSERPPSSEERYALDPIQELATAVRMVPSISTGIATGGASLIPQLLGGGAVAGLSEITARQIERASTDPSLDSIWQDLEGGAFAAGADIVISATTRGLLNFTKGIAKKVVTPKAIPKDVEIAQSVLGQGRSEVSKKWYTWWRKAKPFSLTLQQLNPEERGLVYQLDRAARSGWFSGGRTRKFDLANVEHAQKVFTDYVDLLTDTKSGPEFGAFLKKALGIDAEASDIFKPVEAYRAYLYSFFDKALENANATTDLTPVKNLLLRLKDPRFSSIYRDLKSAGTSGEGLLPSSLKASGWDKVPTKDVDQILNHLGGMVKEKPMDTKSRMMARAVRQLKDAIDKPFNASVKKVPGAQRAKEIADSFFGAKEKALNNATIKQLRKAVVRKPSAVIAMMDPSSGSIGVKYDTFRRFRNALYFSEALPSAPGKYGKGVKRLSESLKVKGVEQLWEDGVLKPLRYRFIFNPRTVDSATGAFNPKTVLNQIQKVEHEAPEMITEIFGGANQIKNLKEFLTTFDVVGRPQAGSSIWLQLAQPGAAAAVAGSAFAFDDPRIKTGAVAGGLTILLAPSALARVFTNPTLTRALTDGAQEASRTGKITSNLAMALRKIATMQAASKTFRDNPSPDAQQFYFGSPQEEIAAAPQEPSQEPLHPPATGTSNTMLTR